MRHTSIVPAAHALCLSVAVSMQGLAGASAQPETAPEEGAGADAAGQAGAEATFKVVTELDKTIFQIFQDSKGVYWFGHDFGEGSGLYRWSGKGNTFDHFTAESGLGTNAIGRMQEDRHGNLFINSHRGIIKFDGRTFTTLTVDESLPAVTEVKLGPDVLWFRAGSDDPHAVFYDGTSLRRLKIPKTADGDAFEARLPRSQFPRRGCPYDAYTIYTDTRGNVWFGTANLGAVRYDGKGFEWISETELGFDEKDNRTFGTRSIIEDRDGKFWITVTRSRFDMYPAAAATRSEGGLSHIKSAGLPHDAGVDEDYTYIMSMTKDKAGDLWMATYGAGVWKYDGKELKEYPVIVDGNPITVFSVYCDREGGLWLGTHEHGVCKFNGTAFEKVRF
jgi:ligand-binding sensor domain-containing protein